MNRTTKKYSKITSNGYSELISLLSDLQKLTIPNIDDKTKNKMTKDFQETITYLANRQQLHEKELPKYLKSITNPNDKNEFLSYLKRKFDQNSLDILEFMSNHRLYSIAINAYNENRCFNRNVARSTSI